MKNLSFNSIPLDRESPHYLHKPQCEEEGAKIWGCKWSIDLSDY